jgi:predicted XRE-type DNA-binding protein
MARSRKPRSTVRYATPRDRRRRVAETMAAYLPFAGPTGGVGSRLERLVETLMDDMRIVRDLAALREERGLSQSDVASLLGVSQPAVAKLESGRVKNLELRTLVRYATVLGGRVRIEIEKLRPRAPGRKPDG